MANLKNNNNKNENKSVSNKITKTMEGTMDLVKDVVEHPMEVAEEFAEQAAKDVRDITWWARLLVYAFWLGLITVALFFLVINLSVTKQWAANQALDIINKDFNAKMSTEVVEVNFFGDVSIKGLKIQDEKGLDFIKVREFRANSDWLRLASNAILGKSNSLSFKTLQLREADIKIITYKGDSVSNFVKFVYNFDSGKPRDSKKPPFQLNSRVEILNSKVLIVNQNKAGDQGVWLNSEQLNLIAPKVRVNGPNVSALINNLTFKTKRWGKKHFVDTFSGELALTSDFLSFKDLTLNTSHSLLQGSLKFNLDKNTGWQDFENKVRWDMTLKRGSQISGYDISYFVTEWDNYLPVNISGKMQGVLNHFYLEDFVMGNKEVSLASHTLSLKNLLDAHFSIESQNISTDFTYVGLKAMLPSFIAEKMKNFADDFGRLRYQGALKLMPQQLYVPKGYLTTGVGQADITGFLLTDYATSVPKYKGDFIIKNLNLSTITKNSQVGLLSGKFHLDGSGFDPDKMVLRTQSEIASIEILNQSIRNISLNGLLNRKTYEGEVGVRDSQVDLDLKGKIDFRTAKIDADIQVDIRYMNIGYFSEKKIQQFISGTLEGKIAMSRLDDLEMDMQVDDLQFTSVGRKYTIPNARAKVYHAHANQVIEVDAPGAVKGRIAGSYNLSNLPGMVSYAIDKILVGPEPKKKYWGQSFNLEFDLKQGLIDYFLPNLRVSDAIIVSGSYDGSLNDLVMNADAKNLFYISSASEAQEAPFMITSSKQDSLKAENVLLRINTANHQEPIFTKIQRAKMGDQIFKDVVLIGRNYENRYLNLDLDFLQGTQDEEFRERMKKYRLSFNQFTNTAGDYVVKFDPTEVHFNGVSWRVDTSQELDHSIVYRKKKGDFLIKHFRIYSDQSDISINHAVFKSTKDFHLEGSVNNFQISKLLDMQEGGNQMGVTGIANGNFDLTMGNSNLEPLVDLNIQNIQMNDESMGNISLEAKKSDRSNVFDIVARVESSGFIGKNHLYAKGTIDNNPKHPVLDIQAEMKDLDLAFSQEFVKGIFSNMRGKATGTLFVTGPLNDIDYNGDIQLKGFGMKLNFTGVDYSFQDTTIPLSKGLAILNDVKLTDGRGNSGGAISGAIQFETLSSMAVQLIIRADNLMVLNTQQKDFDLFWGRVYGHGDLYVSGPVTGLTISTDRTEPFKAVNSSIFTFNAGSTSGVDEYKMLRFLKEDVSTGMMVLEERKKSGANMDLDFNIVVDKNTTVNVVLPGEVGNISVRGTADPLRFTMSKNGTITMSGAYAVDNGTFISQAILERTFHIDRGSSMRWDGDAMTPALDIKTSYTRGVTNLGQYLGFTTLPAVNVKLSVDITGTLNSPNIALGLDVPDLSTQLKEALATKMMNEDEKVIQFGSILVLNAFNVQDTGGFAVDDVAANTGYNMLFKQLGSVFNTISDEVQIDLNYLKGDQASNTSDRANANVSFALSPRITVKTGLGVPLSKGENATDVANYLSGEGIIEYDWSTKNDKTRLVRVYSKPSNIGLVNNAGNAASNQSYGVGVVYSKSFNTVFKRKLKKRKNRKDSLKTDSLRNF